MFKKLLTTALVSILAITAVGCTKQETKKDIISIGMVTDVGGINDGSFNESAYKGLLKAKETLGIDVVYVESRQESDYASNIETLIDQDVDLILGVGYAMTEQFEEAAKQYPDRKFALIDGEFVEVPENVLNIKFKEQEAGYLAGVLAAKTSNTDVIGFIGGMKAPVVDRYKYGFIAGVKDTKPNATVLEQYANSFTDTSKGRAIADHMILKDADIIFHAAGPVGNGMFEALKEKNLLGIGVDTDQNSIAPQTVLTSAVKNLDIATYELSECLLTGNFKGGEAKLNDLTNAGVGIVDPITVATDEAIVAVKKAKEKIITGDIIVPSTLQEYGNYVSSK